MSSILINHRPHDSTRSALLPPTLLSPLLDPNSPHTHLRPQLLLSPSAKRSRRRPRHPPPSPPPPQAAPPPPPAPVLVGGGGSAAAERRLSCPQASCLRTPRS